MKLETDLDKIEKLSEKNDQENWNFRTFLKGYYTTVEEKEVFETSQKAREICFQEKALPVFEK